MPDIIPEDKPLPGFRRDLKLYTGPDSSDGSPSYNLFDPVVNRYYKLSWGEHLVFSRLRPGMFLQELMDDLTQNTTARVDKENLKSFLLECFRFNLFSLQLPSEYYQRMSSTWKPNILKWLLFNYLFMRIPLVKPDKFLSQTLPYVRPLGSPLALVLYAVLGIVGLSLVFLRFGEYINEFSFFFNIEGLLKYGLAITCVKLIHEMSHAYTAKRFGLYVPSMGVALIVLWPMFYTDVTDGWKVANRRHRVYISAAGVIAETIMAGLSTIGWFLTEPGVLNNTFFVISSVTWISTLVVNLNPAIRFDGYYIFSDIWGVDNLQPRSFSLARWKLRQIFFGLHLPNPESQIPYKQINPLIIYALYTWIYRLFLYVAIAIFVYHTFAKALGIFLFFIEIGVFILWPIAEEIKDLSRKKNQLTWNIHSQITTIALGLFFAWVILPWPHDMTFNGITVPREQQTIYVPFDSTIREMRAVRGQLTQVNTPLLQLDSAELSYQVASLELDIELLQRQIDIYTLDEHKRPLIPEKEVELASKNQRLKGLQEIQGDLLLKAQIPGELYLWEDFLREGLTVRKDQVIGKIANSDEVDVVFFVPETDLKAVEIGERVTFHSYPSKTSYSGHITRINPIREQFLAYPPLASSFGGKLPVKEALEDGQLILVEAFYSVHVTLDSETPPPHFGKTGEVEVRGPWRSYLIEVMRSILRIIWKEGSV